MKWITMVLGLALFLAPFLSGFSGQPGLLWFSMIAGASVAVLGFFKAYKWAAAASLLIFLAPWVLGFSGAIAAIWCWIIGLIGVALTGYLGFRPGRRQTPVERPLA